MQPDKRTPRSSMSKVPLLAQSSMLNSSASVYMQPRSTQVGAGLNPSPTPNHLSSDNSMPKYEALHALHSLKRLNHTTMKPVTSQLVPGETPVALSNQNRSNLHQVTPSPSPTARNMNNTHKQQNPLHYAYQPRTLTSTATRSHGHVMVNRIRCMHCCHKGPHQPWSSRAVNRINHQQCSSAALQVTVWTRLRNHACMCAYKQHPRPRGAGAHIILHASPQKSAQRDLFAAPVSSAPVAKIQRQNGDRNTPPVQAPAPREAHVLQSSVTKKRSCKRRTKGHTHGGTRCSPVKMVAMHGMHPRDGAQRRWWPCMACTPGATHREGADALISAACAWVAAPPRPRQHHMGAAQPLPRLPERG